MEKSKPVRLGDLQLKIMKLLWREGELTVAEIHRELRKNKLFAYTTIATMLRKMEERGLVAHRVEGRTYIYCAAIEEEAVSRRMAGDLLDRLFEGSLADMVSHLISTREISSEELTRLEHLLSERKKK